MGSSACRIGVVAALLLGAGSTLGCSASSATTAGPATGSHVAEDDDDLATDLFVHHGYHHHGGVVLFIAMSLDTVGVSFDRRVAAEKVARELRARMLNASAAEQSLLTLLADEVVGPTVSTTQVDAAVERLVGAAEALHEASAQALNDLHTLLTPPERAALVDKVNAHWRVWQRANPEDVGMSPSSDAYVSALAGDLDLTAEQFDKIRVGVTGAMKGGTRLNREAVAAYLGAFGDAFRRETFDAHSLGSANRANAELVRWGATRMARFVASVSPVLTPAQQAKFSGELRQHAAHCQDVPGAT